MSNNADPIKQCDDEFRKLLGVSERPLTDIFRWCEDRLVENGTITDEQRSIKAERTNAENRRRKKA